MLCLERSFQTTKSLADQGFDLNLSINISTINLNENDFAEFTISLFEKYQVAPGNIILEITETAVDMGHGLGFQVVAEGAEDTETLSVLREMNCDYIQGYYLSKPLPLQELIDWLHSNNSSPQNMKLM